MRFIHPEFLWLFALAVPLAALHLWKRRPRPRTVPCLALWQRTLAAHERRFGVRKLRRLLSLLIHLLVLCLFTLGAAKPRPAQDPSPPRAVVLVADLSASMAARDGGGGRTRMEAAAEKAMVTLEGLDPADRVALIGAGRRPRLLLPLCAGPWRAKRLLHYLDPGEPATDLPAAVDLARTIARDLKDATILVLTDRSGVDEGLPDNIPRIVTGTEGENASLVGLRVEQRWGQPKARLFVRIRNAGQTARTGVLSARWLLRMDAEGNEVGEAEDAGATRVPLAPMSRTGVEMEIAAGQGGLLEVHLDAGDVLPLDDDAYAVVFPHPRPRVIVVAAADPDPFLVGGLEALSASLDAEESFQTTPADLPKVLAELSPPVGPADVVIFDRCAPDRDLPLANVVTFGAEGAHAPVQAGEAAQRLTAWSWNRTHPLLAQLMLDPLRVGKGRVLRAAQGDDVLVQSAGGPILVAGRRGRARVVAFGFAAKDSNLPLLVAFPLLLKNLFAWFAFDRWLAFRTEGRVGEPIALAEGFREGVTTMELDYVGRWGPRARTWVCEVEGGVPLLPECPWPGFYRARWGGQHEWIAVNFPGGAESALRAATGKEHPGPPVFQRTPPPSFDAEALWLHLCAAGMGLLVIEWVLFHRGGGV